MRNLEMMLIWYPFLSEEINRLNQEMNVVLQERLAKEESFLKAKQLREIVIQINGEVDPVYEIVRELITRYDAELERIARRINELLDERAAVESFVTTLDPIEKTIITMRYLERDRSTWGEIASRVKYNQEHCQRMCKDVIRMAKAS